MPLLRIGLVLRRRLGYQVSGHGGRPSALTGQRADPPDDLVPAEYSCHAVQVRALPRAGHRDPDHLRGIYDRPRIGIWSLLVRLVGRGESVLGCQIPDLAEPFLAVVA